MNFKQVLVKIKFIEELMSNAEMLEVTKNALSYTFLCHY